MDAAMRRGVAAGWGAELGEADPGASRLAASCRAMMPSDRVLRAQLAHAARNVFDHAGVGRYFPPADISLFLETKREVEKK
ncbi:hypothetical protein [Streptomyces mobaraensis]|uniref:hypothetical protein n=1 Tax=Streptomyces mobaraensis TaxID=35621 RepID=UPI0033CEAEE3